MDELVTVLIGALINGAMLAVGMVLGSKLTSKSVVKEVDRWLERSETFQAIKTMVTDQTLIEKATKFFEEATILVGSPEAKNFFQNAVELMQRFAKKTEKPEIPEPD